MAEEEYEAEDETKSSKSKASAAQTEYQKAMAKFLKEEKEEEINFMKRLEQKRLTLQQSHLNEQSELRAKAKAQALLLRKKKDIEQNLEAQIKQIWADYETKVQQLRNEFKSRIEKMIQEKKNKFETDKANLKKLLENELAAKRKLCESECQRIERVKNMPLDDADRRDFVKKIMVDYKEYPDTVLLADELALKRCNANILKYTIAVNKTCIIYRASFNGVPCCCKVVVMHDRTLRYKPGAPMSSKIRRFLSKDKPQHEGFIRIFDIFITDSKLYTFMDECNSTNLLEMSRAGKIRYEELQQYMKTILSCLIYMHQRAFAHLKVRPESVMFDLNNKQIKLGGFGNAVSYFDSNTERFLRLPRPHFHSRYLDNHLPPEVFKESDFDPQSADVFSFGLLIYLLWINIGVKRGKKVRGAIKIDEKLIQSPALKKLLHVTTGVSADQRSKIFPLINHEYFSGVESGPSPAEEAQYEETEGTEESNE